MTLPDGRKWALKCTSVLKNDPILGLFKLINDGVQKRFDGEQETYQNDKKNRPYIILFGNLLSLSCSSRFLASKHGVFVPSGQIQSPERATFQTMNSVVSPCSYAVFQWRHKISVLVFWAFFCCIFIKRKMKLLKSIVHTYPNILKTIFSSVLSFLPSTIKRRFQAPKTYVL